MLRQFLGKLIRKNDGLYAFEARAENILNFLLKNSDVLDKTFHEKSGFWKEEIENIINSADRFRSLYRFDQMLLKASKIEKIVYKKPHAMQRFLIALAARLRKKDEDKGILLKNIRNIVDSENLKQIEKITELLRNNKK